MEDIIKAVKSLEESGLLKKCVSETIEDEVKEQKSFSVMVAWGGHVYLSRKQYQIILLIYIKNIS